MRFPRLFAPFLPRIICTIVIASLIPLAAFAANTAIANNTPGFIKKAVDRGPSDPTATMSVTVWLKLHNETGLDKLVQQQHSKASPNYHKWISQSDFDASYGPTLQQVNAVSNFLAAHNLAVTNVAENNMFVRAQGTVADVEKTFHVQLNNFTFQGQMYRSNKADPSVSDFVGGNIAAVTGLDTFGFQPANVRPISPDGEPYAMRALSNGPNGTFFAADCFRPPETHTFSKGSDTATYTGNRYGADITNSTLGTLPPCGYSPQEVQTAYNLTPLYSAQFDGTGQTVAIVDAYGSSTIERDADVFSQIYGLPRITSANFSLVKAPGLGNNPFGVARGWDGETTLDVEWVHAIAPGASIALVVATDRSSLDEAINYAVVHHLANTISNSWGLDEAFGNPAQFIRVNRILQMASVEGIDVNFSTGDFGDEQSVVGFTSVQFPASSPFSTAIGGTSLALNADHTMSWQEGWGTNETRIADTLALGNPPQVPPLHFGFVFGAGGGTSRRFAKPSFQSSLPGANRMTPDIGWLADPFTGVEIIETVNGTLSVGVIGGTSLACPMFSGLMAIASQKAGHPLGQAAPLVYGLSSSQTTATPLYDVVQFNSPTNVTGVVDGTPFSADQLAAPLGNTTGYFSAMYNSPFSTRWFVLTFGTDSSLTTNAGWDNVTGVGTPNGVNFVNAIAP